ncbi:hypothetical protein IT408_03035 [Candidatus Uhrbacteria bacterium]|nr:hypothetical protein [Candidatus Uhrbacteria bacterium]
MSLLSKTSVFVLSLSLVLSGSPVSASGVLVALTPGTGNAGSNATVLSWLPTGIYPTGTVLQVDISPAVSSVDVLTGSTTNIGNNGWAVWSTTSTGNLILTVVTSTNSSAASSSLYIPFTIDATAQNYSFSILTASTTSSTVPVDFGASLFYANGGNLVTVTAAVPATLSFAIRTDADDANTNLCSLGTLGVAATSTCAYRLRVGTNAAGGFSTTILANHDFANASYATMTNVGDNGVANAGSEGYGISVFTSASTGGRNAVTSAYDQPITEASVVGFDFSVDPTPVPTSTAVLMQSFPRSFRLNSSPSLTTTSRVVHFANIDSATPAGFYSQVVTYIVTATF